ncbi:hypothetical protein LG52_3891 [Geobacillus kaustophilus]|uniref:Uncharacterized protein n=1 Tax=Geobacillus kaustophilus TaxID=1462 RepID=A0A0D8BUS5_GEOKU|nr:hypothetical protein [Geobacillus kaustophilus]KJE27926.1 hypothetical protein LG52_2659 [Geobacillus kaustophilus]KJE32233.1 hypothetical protein LG52_3891 [Geobacillus kaustophilus]
MKEIIYLNTEIMNSLIAQLDKGITTYYSLEQTIQETNTETSQTTRGKAAGFNGTVQSGTGSLLSNVSLSFGANISGNGNETNGSSRALLEGQRDLLNKAFHDYALNILLQLLKENEKLKTNSCSLTEGDICLWETDWKYYDFEFISRIADLDDILETLGIYVSADEYRQAETIVQKTKKYPKNPEFIRAQHIINQHQSVMLQRNILKQIQVFSSYANSFLGNYSIIKAANTFQLIDKGMLREVPTALSIRSASARKAKILFRVIGKRDIIHNNDDLCGVLGELQDFTQLANFMFDLILGSFQILKQGDYIATPIAIYYE